MQHAVSTLLYLLRSWTRIFWLGMERNKVLNSLIDILRFPSSPMKKMVLLGFFCELVADIAWQHTIRPRLYADESHLLFLE